MSKYTEFGDLLTVGIMFPVCIAIGYGIGYLLDAWLGTHSVFKIVFLLFGIVAAFLNLFKTINKVEKDERS